MSSTRRIVLGGLAAASAVALLAGCSAPPKSTSSASSSSFLPCVVGDTGGFNDHSFNELALDGVTSAAKKAGVSFKKYQVANANGYDAAISSLVSQKCSLIVAPGFNFPKPVGTSAKAHPKIKYAVIDDNSLKLANVKDMVFETDEASFLGGYIAASYSKTGVVATWGGAQYPSVTIYEDGIADGIAYYNQQKGKSVQLLGWDESTQKGTFVGNFTDQTAAKTITQNFLDQKADVIIPVAGSLYQGAATAIQSSGSSAVLEGVDADLYNTDPKYRSLYLVSILKQVGVAASDVTTATANGTFSNSTYIGTLKNNGVGISPFHDFSSKVDSSLSGELKKIESGIESGSITVASPSGFLK